MARALGRDGCDVRILSNNWRQRDLQIVTPDRRTVFVETKTVRRNRACWIVNTPPDPSLSQFWILVYAPRAAEGLPRDDEVRFFVLTAEEALAAWHLSPPPGSQAQIRGDIRWHNLPPGCESNFAKITRPR